MIIAVVVSGAVLAFGVVFSLRTAVRHGAEGKAFGRYVDRYLTIGEGWLLPDGDACDVLHAELIRRSDLASGSYGKNWRGEPVSLASGT